MSSAAAFARATALPEFVDPYLDPDTGILRNLVGAVSSDDLAAKEVELTAFRAIELFERPVKPPGDLRQLQSIYQRVLQDVYEGAGELRTVDMRKGRDPAAEFFMPVSRLQSGVDDIAQAHETVAVWRDHDEIAREAEDVIRLEVSERYGIDVDAPGADPAAVAAALHDSDRDRADLCVERERSGEELTASQILFANADRHEREAKERAERDWNSDERRADGWKLTAEATGESRVEGDDDSSEHRRQFAACLEGKVDRRTIDAGILADGENAKHPPARLWGRSLAGR